MRRVRRVRKVERKSIDAHLSYKVPEDFSPLLLAGIILS
jgi:hypothetical protein